MARRPKRTARHKRAGSSAEDDCGAYWRKWPSSIRITCCWESSRTGISGEGIMRDADHSMQRSKIHDRVYTINQNCLAVEIMKIIEAQNR